MLVTLYADIWPGMLPENVSATAQPMMPKPDTYKRYKIQVNFPESAFVGEIAGTPVVEEITEIDKGSNPGAAT